MIHFLNSRWRAWQVTQKRRRWALFWLDVMESGSMTQDAWTPSVWSRWSRCWDQDSLDHPFEPRDVPRRKRARMVGQTLGKTPLVLAMALSDPRPLQALLENGAVLACAMRGQERIAWDLSLWLKALASAYQAGRDVVWNDIKPRAWHGWVWQRWAESKSNGATNGAIDFVSGASVD